MGMEKRNGHQGDQKKCKGRFHLCSGWVPIYDSITPNAIHSIQRIETHSKNMNVDICVEQISYFNLTHGPVDDFCGDVHGEP